MIYLVTLFIVFKKMNRTPVKTNPILRHKIKESTIQEAQRNLTSKNLLVKFVNIFSNAREVNRFFFSTIHKSYIRPSFPTIFIIWLVQDPPTVQSLIWVYLKWKFFHKVIFCLLPQICSKNTENPWLFSKGSFETRQFFKLIIFSMEIVKHKLFMHIKDVIYLSFRFQAFKPPPYLFIK